MAVCNRLMNSDTVRTVIGHYWINQTDRRDSGIKQCSSL